MLAKKRGGGPQTRPPLICSTINQGHHQAAPFYSKGVFRGKREKEETEKRKTLN